MLASIYDNGTQNRGKKLVILRGAGGRVEHVYDIAFVNK